MPKYEVILRHNVANASRAIIEASNANDAEKKAIELGVGWRCAIRRITLGSHVFC
jgi:hypothetical protein